MDGKSITSSAQDESHTLTASDVAQVREYFAGTEVAEQAKTLIDAIQETAENLRERYREGMWNPAEHDWTNMPDGPNTPWHKRKIKKFTESETKAILHNVNAKLARMPWR